MHLCYRKKAELFFLKVDFAVVLIFYLLKIRFILFLELLLACKK